MGQCPLCKSRMVLLDGRTEEGIVYKYTKCTVCDHEIIDRKTFHAVTRKVRVSKRYAAKLGRWGKSLGVRFPKKIVMELDLDEKTRVVIVPDGEGLRILCQKPL